MEGEPTLNIFQKMIYSLIKPEQVFKYIRREPFSLTFLYFLFINLIPTLIRIVLVLLNIPSQPNESIGSILSGYVLTILLAFLIAGIFHLFAKVFGGEASYDGTYKAYCYGFTPSVLVGWIKYIGILGVVYGIYVFIRGISFIHAIPGGKAFLVWFLPMAILALIILALIALVGVAIISYLAGLYSSNPYMQETIQTTGYFLKIIK
ncbi:MAG: Yip1 family protein [Candidatus Aenigmarchaeota archaeon]|nr:YIP1 family protein [Candidatus Aenigmarchaeota archaeon]MDW8149811.1 Yip1 family protein [Candidatus Aenigmarchaeota archaeon]